MDAGPRQFHWTEGRGVNAALNWCGLDNCTKESWQSRVWLNEGEVNALALDKHGAVWVSMNRRGLGLVPPFGGVRLFDGVDWYAYNPSNTPMSSLNVTSLAPFGDGVYLGTMNAGVTIFSFTIPPTATPAPTFTPSATPSSTPSQMSTVLFAPTSTASPFDAPLTPVSVLRVICKDRFTFCHSPDGNEPAVGDGVTPGAVVADAVGEGVRLAVAVVVDVALAVPPACVAAVVDVADGVPGVACWTSVGDGPIVGTTGPVGLAVGGRRVGVDDGSAVLRGIVGRGVVRLGQPVPLQKRRL